MGELSCVSCFLYVLYTLNITKARGLQVTAQKGGGGKDLYICCVAKYVLKHQISILYNGCDVTIFFYVYRCATLAYDTVLWMSSVCLLSSVAVNGARTTALLHRN